ncbi:hypothetical protein DXG03_006872 [Asterophora parasitica]|uniref:MYND-type domain-containing protein n=1 Tax=Asterophora parasitica TaxID=117018 RepID=A0A9P7K728_9AGAR|nr:hypothetical protein DXG03_006872 [Asterophora parasitica]
MAVHEICLDMRDDPKCDLWEGLVDAGIVDTLCMNVVTVPTMPPSPNVPANLLEAKKEIQSPYIAALEIICDAVSSPLMPRKTDEKIVDALRKNWPGMMKWIWKEQKNTLEPWNRTAERTVLAHIIVRLVSLDPSFLKVFYVPSDLTIQIIARHWKDSLAGEDIDITAVALLALLRPRTFNLPPKKILPKILLGVTPVPPATTAAQANTLIASFTAHLNDLGPRATCTEMHFFSDLVYVAWHGDTAEPEVCTAILTSKPLWNTLFRLLKKASTPSSEAVNSEPPDNNRAYLVNTVMRLMKDILYHASAAGSKEGESLARIWVEENLFGILDEMLEQLLKFTGFTMLLKHLLEVVVDHVVSECSPPLRQLFRAQFPRFRMLGVLIRHHMKRLREELAREQQEREIRMGVPFLVPTTEEMWHHDNAVAFMKAQDEMQKRWYEERDAMEREELRWQQKKWTPLHANVLVLDDSETLRARDRCIWDQEAYEAFAILQATCLGFSEKMCGKRGCENAGTVKCSWCRVKYCSEGCKTG